jgi:hypothetical protein
MSTLTVTVPTNLWMSANRPIANHGHKARIVRDIHTLVTTEAIRQKLTPTQGLVAVDWFIAYPKGTRRDKGEASNSQPTCKAILDALVPRWLPDDGPAYVTSERYQRVGNLTVSRDHVVQLVLTSQEIPWEEPA